MSTFPHTAQAGGGGERLACRDAEAAACPPRVGPWENISRTVAPRGAERCRGFPRFGSHGGVHDFFMFKEREA